MTSLDYRVASSGMSNLDLRDCHVNHMMDIVNAVNDLDTALRKINEDASFHITVVLPSVEEAEDEEKKAEKFTIHHRFAAQ